MPPWQTPTVIQLTEAIQNHLQAVEQQRERRRRDSCLGHRVFEVKRFQHARFCDTYRDLLEAPKSAKATRFFLDELYGPIDFSDRDAEFSRVAPKVAALFPGEIGHILLNLAHLHALSERLDSDMGAAVTTIPLSTRDYRRAWVTVGQPSARNEQVALVLQLGMALSQQVNKPLIRTTLRVMRHPARAAGLGNMQSMLEHGLDAFRELPHPQEFVLVIAERETAFINELFNKNIADDRHLGTQSPE